jgi:hypothetical protein
MARARQEPGDPYHYYVTTEDHVKVRMKAVGTAHLVAAVLDDIAPPPPPTRTPSAPWIDYDFEVTKSAPETHRLRVEYSFSIDAGGAPANRCYVHEVVIDGKDGSQCTYNNIADMCADSPLPVNTFRFTVVTEDLRC